mmetsp:Transcript_48376/g.121915  ORF Transcript_48376/g.121915 Transcript_48376/m.121915 type:complete len:624 (+) Transcript_48376:71-1942(+)
MANFAVIAVPGVFGASSASAPPLLPRSSAVAGPPGEGPKSTVLGAAMHAWQVVPAVAPIAAATTALARKRRRAAITNRRAAAETTLISPVSANKQAPTPSTFTWARQWYPVTSLAMLEGNGPVPLKLLGKELVLWRDGDQGDWRCTSGVCPHRLAPLAKGRVNDEGQLMCRFHGWCFRGQDGACVKVPMAEGDAEAERLLLDAPRTTLATYPTKVKAGLLFIWPDSSSAEEAAAKEPFMAEELGDAPTWNVIDAPASWRVWMEQTWDPSHAPFLHEFTLPFFAPENANPMAEFKIQDLGDEGLLCEHGGYMQSNMGLQARRVFGAPCANFSTYKYPDGREVGFHFYFVPTEVGKVRQITTSFFKPAPSGVKDASQGGLRGNQLTVSKVVPRGRTLERVKEERRGLKQVLVESAEKRWPQFAKVRRGLKVLRILQGRLGDQDNAVLSFQDSIGLPAVQSGALRAPKPSERFGGPPSEYVLETHADAHVARFNAWLAERGGGPFGETLAAASSGGAAAVAAATAPPGEADLMDRWQAHTKFSPDARAALNFTAGFASRLEATVAPALLATTGACLALGAARLASLPAFAAAVALYGSARLRRMARGFLSGLPEAPAAPSITLWER